MEFDIQHIITQMQEFQKEYDGEFKDGKTFWKHYYKKLDGVIFKELQKLINSSDEQDFGININRKEEEKTNDDVIDFIKNIADKIGIDVEVEKITIK